MLTGWQWINGKCYFFASGGAMVKNRWIGTDYVGEDGAWIPGYSGVAIMGAPTVTVNQMITAYNTKPVEYPSQQLSLGGAPTIESFCQILYDVAVSEGVRPEVLFSQAMLETGWLKYGNDVKILQFNFGGIGATGGGAQGASFPDVRTGLLAQTQHLKAYSTDSSVSLNNGCVDPRFDLVQRGCAPIVEWLGIQENPYGKGWAAGKDYGYNMLRVMKDSFGHY